jgi:hypothetical protein
LKLHLSILILLMCVAATVMAQDLVYPNRPVAMLKSNRGLITMLEYHGGAGVDDEGVPFSKRFSGFNALIGYQINKNFIIAGGTGISIYNGGSFIPAYMDLRYTFYLSQMAAYLYADGGLLLNVSKIDTAQMFMNPGIGVRYSISRRFAITFSAGILVQTAEQDLVAFFNLRTGITYKFWRKTSGYRIKSTG